MGQVPKCFDDAESQVTTVFDNLINAVRSRRETLLTEIKTLRMDAEALLHNRTVEAEDLKKRVAEVRSHSAEATRIPQN